MTEQELWAVASQMMDMGEYMDEGYEELLEEDENS